MKSNKRSEKEVNIRNNEKEIDNHEGEQEHRLLMGGKNERLRSKNISNIRSHCIVAKTMPIRHEPNPETMFTNEVDTNADTCYLGSNFIDFSYFNRSGDAHPYSDEYKPMKNIPIASGATAFNHPDGNTYILIFNDCLSFGTKM